MLVSKYQKLEERVVAALAAHPLSTATTLQKEIAVLDRLYTIQAIYQELRKLIRAGVVAKFDDAYSLRFDWLLELSRFSKITYEAHTRTGQLTKIIPEKGKSVRWRFQSLNEAVLLWTQLVFALLEKSDDQILYEYLPHVWFHLVQWHDEGIFERAIREAGFTQYVIVVGDTYLDRLFEHFFQERPGEYSFGNDPFGKHGLEYISVVGSYIVTVVINGKTQKQIETLYTSVTNSKDISISDIVTLFEKGNRVTLKVQHSEMQAKKLRRKFDRFFTV